jgi:hypothetical protein
MPSWTWAPNNWWAFVPSLSNAITFDLERGLLCLITPTAAVKIRRPLLYQGR